MQSSQQACTMQVGTQSLSGLLNRCWKEKAHREQTQACTKDCTVHLKAAAPRPGRNIACAQDGSNGIVHANFIEEFTSWFRHALRLLVAAAQLVHQELLSLLQLLADAELGQLLKQPWMVLELLWRRRGVLAWNTISKQLSKLWQGTCERHYDTQGQCACPCWHSQASGTACNQVHTFPPASSRRRECCACAPPPCQPAGLRRRLHAPACAPRAAVSPAQQSLSDHPCTCTDQNNAYHIYTWYAPNPHVLRTVRACTSSASSSCGGGGAFLPHLTMSGGTCVYLVGPSSRFCYCHACAACMQPLRACHTLDTAEYSGTANHQCTSGCLSGHACST